MSSEPHVKMSAADKFQAALKVIQSLPKDGPYQPSNSSKLKFYSLYKQATEGSCNIAKPGFWDIVGRAKWESWNRLGTMNKEDAMNEYVEELKTIVETMSFSGDVQEFLDCIGPFYEFINLQGPEMNHIKESIEQYTSSSGSSASSNSNSCGSSPVTSIPNSPLKTQSTKVEQPEVSQKSETEIEDKVDQLDTNMNETSSDKAIIQSNGHLPQMEQNGFQSQSSSSLLQAEYGTAYTSASMIPPPTPLHAHTKKVPNGFVKFADNIDEENERDDEVMEVSHHQELPHDIEKLGNGHVQVSCKASNDTIATSGTESDKYYSGDSDPEFDERFSSISFEADSGSNPYPSSSGYQSYKDDQGLKAQVVKSNGYVTAAKGALDSLAYKGSHEIRTSSNHAAKRKAEANLILHTTVDRLNRDIDHILARLRILEAAYADGNSSARNSNIGVRPRRVFSDLSASTLTLIFAWPFAVHFLMKLFFWWLRRRRQAAIGARI